MASDFNPYKKNVFPDGRMFNYEWNSEKWVLT